jgi:hypothetical protein
MSSGGFRWATRFSPQGVPYSFVEHQVPRIPNDALESVVYLYPSEAAAEDGEQIGGTGFLIGIPIPYVQPAPVHLRCVVTNAHIIDRGSMVVRINTTDGAMTTVALDGAEWFRHPDGDDIAICPIGLDNQRHKYKYIHPNMFLRKELISMFDIGPGDDVYIVGRFINREGRQKNIPSVRFGNIAQMPGEPLILEEGKEQECFLIEGRSIPGFSGAPVFIQIVPEAPEFPEFPPDLKQYQPKPSTNRPKLNFKAGPFLMGIDFCHLFNKDKVVSDLTGKPVSDDWHVRSNTGMMGVIPMWRIMDVIDSPKMKNLRDGLEQEVKKIRSSQVSLDVADKGVPPAGDENPDHLKDFTRLVDLAAKKRSDA